uniref:7TM_GPCR_Srx domain-containing protein n=1 Tax=Meloidogyne hapla TaxID=6305 RepID=A0A1I8AXK9_MELHA
MLLPVALFGAGSALCTLNSEILHPFSVSLFGASLAIIWPATWLQFINELNCKNTQSINKNNKNIQISTAITIILISSHFGPLIFPFILTQIYSIYGGPELFTSIELFFIFLMVIAFVCILNNQANQLQSGNQFWHWFRGEGGRRTRRSIRLFVSSFRGSLKRRQKASRNRQNRRRVGTADSALLEESSFGHSALSNYNSFQTLNERITNNNSRQSNQNRLIFSRQMSEQQKEIKNNSKPNSPLSLRRTQFSLPSIVIHQETPTGSRGSVNS